MSEFGSGDCFLADCSARLTLELIADKWTVVTLYGLSRGPVRHGELVDLIGSGISRKVLTETLRRLESHGLVRRHAYADAPPRVDYELTELGATLIDPIHVLTEWARANGDAVLDALDAAADRRPSGGSDGEDELAQEVTGVEPPVRVGDPLERERLLHVDP